MENIVENNFGFFSKFYVYLDDQKNGTEPRREQNIRKHETVQVLNNLNGFSNVLKKAFTFATANGEGAGFLTPIELRHIPLPVLISFPVVVFLVDLDHHRNSMAKNDFLLFVFQTAIHPILFERAVQLLGDELQEVGL